MTEKNRFEKYLEKQAKESGKKDVKPWDLLNPNTEYVDRETSDARYDICNLCPELISLLSNAKNAGALWRLKQK